MPNLLVNLLIGAYALAWALCFTNPKGGMLFLCITAGLLCLPYFAFQFLKAIAANLFITAVLTALSVVFPPLGVVVLLWAAIMMVARFGRLLSNAPTIIIGILLYAAALGIPRGLHSSSLAGFEGPWLLGFDLVLMAAGVFAAVGALKLGQGLGHSRLAAAALMFGFSAYIALFVVTLFLPGIDDGHGDIGDHTT